MLCRAALLCVLACGAWGGAWAQGGGGGADRETIPSVLIAVPTAPRRSGRDYLPAALESIRASTAAAAAEGDTRVRVEVMVMHDSGQRPDVNATFFVERPPPTVSAPCKFFLWRRRLVMDFVFLMQHALNQSDAEYLMWLEDDGILHPSWPEAIREADTQCFSALHPCNYANCIPENTYNGIGVVAALFKRDRLIKLLPLILERVLLAPLDEILETICLNHPELGPAMYRMPPAADHTGDIALGTTKLAQATRVVINSPAAGSVVSGTVDVSVTFYGMVYDAEYSWSVTINDIQVSGKSSFKLVGPKREEDCIDDTHFSANIRLMSFPPGWSALRIYMF